MGVFKEELHFLTNLEKEQERIWEDSADVGIYTKDIDMDRMREVITTLLELPGSEVEWKQKAHGWNQRTYNLIIMWGCNSPNIYDATQIKVNWYKDKKKEFFSIDSRAVLTTKDGKVISVADVYFVED